MALSHLGREIWYILAWCLPTSPPPGFTNPSPVHAGFSARIVYSNISSVLHASGVCLAREASALARSYPVGGWSARPIFSFNLLALGGRRRAAVRFGDELRDPFIPLSCQIAGGSPLARVFPAIQSAVLLFCSVWPNRGQTKSWE